LWLGSVPFSWYACSMINMVISNCYGFISIQVVMVQLCMSTVVCIVFHHAYLVTYNV